MARAIDNAIVTGAEEAMPYQKDSLLSNIANILNEHHSFTCEYNNGGIDVFQGSPGVGYVYMRIKADRSGESLQSYIS